MAAECMRPQAHFILDEMVMNGAARQRQRNAQALFAHPRCGAGCIVETNRLKVLTPVQLLDKADAAVK